MNKQEREKDTDRERETETDRYQGLRSGGKSDLTSEDRERSMTSIILKLTFFHDSGAM